MEEFSTAVLVVAVAMVGLDGRVLLQQRRTGGRHGGLWEFPGGKVEAGESPESALVREISEELGVELAAEALCPLTFASDPTQPPLPREPHVILLYTCRQWTGEPRCLDGEAIAWVAPSDFAGLAMPPLDYPLAEAVRSLLLPLANPKRHP